jgi:hypothetical protein
VKGPMLLDPTSTMVVVHIEADRWAFATATGPGPWLWGEGTEAGSWATLTAVALNHGIRFVRDGGSRRLTIAVADWSVRALLTGGELPSGASRFDRLIRGVMRVLMALRDRQWTIEIVDPMWLDDAAGMAWVLGRLCQEQAAVDPDDGFGEGDPPDPENDWREDFPDRRTWDAWVAAGWGGAPWTAGAWYRAGYGPEEAMQAGGLPTIDRQGVE